LSSINLHAELDAPARALLATALADAPENCLQVHFLRRNLCRAWVAGDPHSPVAALIQPAVAPDELLASGSSAEDIWSLLRAAENWSSVRVEAGVADALARLFEERDGKAVSRYDAVCFLGHAPVITHPKPYVRLLTALDRRLLDGLPESRAGACWDGADVLLRDGFAAGAVMSGRLVSVAFTSACTDRYAHIDAFTMPGWRRRGNATAAVALVAATAANRGLGPIWHCTTDSAAGLKLAGALSLAECARLTHLVPVRAT
jgi:hypothetical protein